MEDNPDMTEASGTQLLERFRQGDRQAFAELVRLHQGPLLRHARGLLGPGSPYEDVVQDAFLKLAQNPPVLSDPPRNPGGDGAEGDLRSEQAQLSAWLHTVTRNLCMDVMRSETRRKKREHDVAASEVSSGGIAAVEAADTRAAVEEKLTSLPVDQREVLVLRLLGEKSYREIAAITGKKIGTVGWLVSVGLKALSTELAPLFQVTPRGNSSAPTVAKSNFGLAQGELQ